jgi:hypothetical protein
MSEPMETSALEKGCFPMGREQKHMSRKRGKKYNKMNVKVNK